MRHRCFHLFDGLSMRAVYLVVAAVVLRSGNCDATQITWTNIAGGNWSVAANWSPNQVPSSVDTVLITQSGTYTVVMDVSSATVASLTLGAGGGAAGVQTLGITNNTLTANPLAVTNGGALLANNATFPGAVTVGNGAVFGDTSSVTVNASGSVTVAAGGALNLGGSLSLFGPLTNSGTINLTNSGITIYNGTSGYQGGLVNQPGGLIDFWGNAGISGAYGQDYFINKGTLAKSGGSSTTISLSLFDTSTGTATNLSGSLILGVFTNSLAGTFYSANGAVIQFNGGVASIPLTPGTPLVLGGAGQYQFTSGYLSLPTNVVPGLVLQGGFLTLGGSFQGGAITNLSLDGITLTNTLPVTGPLNVTNSTIYGSFTVANGGVVNANSATFQATMAVAAGGAFDDNGSVTLNAGGSLTVAGGGALNLASPLYLYGPLTNSGTINLTNSGISIYNGVNNYQGGLVNQAGGLVDVWGNAGISGAYGQDYFINKGVLTKNGGASTTIGLSFFDTSAGTVTNLSGTLSLSSITNTLAGIFYATNGAVIQLGGGSSSDPLTAGTPLVLGGGGQYEFTSGYLLLPTNVISGLVLQGGVLELDGSFQGGAITNLSVDGMTLTNTLPVTGSFNVTNSTVAGNFTVAGGAVLNANSATFLGVVTVASGGLFNCNGTVTTVTVANGAVFNDIGSASVTANGSVTVAGGGALNLAGPLYLYGPLTNSGTINLTNSGITIYNGIANFQGGLVNQTGGLVDIWGYAGISGAYGQDYFINKGMLTKSGGTSTAIALSFFDTSAGTVTNLSGTLGLSAFTNTLAGTFYATNGTVIQLGGGISSDPLTAGTPLLLGGGGQYEFTSGYLFLPTNVIPGLVLQGGVLELGGSFQGGVITNLALDGITLTNTLPVTGIFNVTNSTVAGNFTVTSGAVLNANSATFLGAVTVASGGLFNCNGTVTTVTVANGAVFNDLGSVSVTANGSVTVAGGGALNMAGPLYLYGPLTNSGTINMTNSGITIYNGVANYQGGLVNQAGGLVDIWGYAGISGAYGQDYFINKGMLTKNGGSSTAISLSFFDTSAGTVTNLSGTLSLSAFTNTLAGTFYATIGTVIQLGGGVSSDPLTAGTPLVLGGGGQYEFTSGYLLLPTNVIPGLVLQGGVLELGGSFQGGAITNLALNGITLTNALPVTGSFNVTNSTVAGNFTVAGGAALNASSATFLGAVMVASGGLFNCNGTVTTVTVANGAVFNDLGSVSVTANGSITVAGGGALNMAGPLYLYGPLTNSGTISMTNSGITIYNGVAGYQGGLVNQAGGLVDIWGYAGVSGAYGQDYFINRGTVAKISSASTASISISKFTNSGAITSQRGTFQLNPVTLLSTGSLNVGLNGPTDFGNLAFAGNAALAGTLGVTLNSGFLPSFGEAFNVLTYGSFSGSFANTNLQSIVSPLGSPGLQKTVLWQIAYGSTALSITATQSTFQFIYNGTNGTPGHQYIVLTSTNAQQSLPSWKPVTTNSFDTNGGFAFTNSVDTTKRQQFFILKIQ